MTGRPHPQLGRIGRVVATALIAGLPLLAPVVSGGTATSAAAVTSVLPISITLGRPDVPGIRPLAPQPGDILTVNGSLTNTSSEQVTDLNIELEVNPAALIGRGNFDDYAADPTGDLDGLIPVTSPLLLHDPTLNPGQSEPFTIKVSVQSLVGSSDTWGVYELGLAVTGDTDFTPSTLGQLRTFLPYAPRDAAAGRDRIDLAWLWPLVDRPHQGIGSTWDDDDLAPELAAGGRLGTLLDAVTNVDPANTVAKVPVTFAIDPMLLNDVDTMRTAYKVSTGGGHTVDGSGSADATQFLNNLRTDTTQGNVMALPYADPDIAAEVRSGLSTLLAQAHTNGNQLVSKLLPGATTVNADWPPGGMLDERSVDALQSDGLTGLVLTDNALKPADGAQSETPSAHTTLTTDLGTIDTALSDSTLSGAVNDGANPSADSDLAIQRVMAETLMIEAEYPSDQRDILIAPSRRWSPSLTYAQTLLADTGKVPWLRPVTLSQVLASPPDTKVARAPLSYPGSARRAELSPTYMGEVQGLQQSVYDLSSILPATDRSTLPYSAPLLRAVSSAWRSDPVDQESQLSGLQQSIKTALHSVRIASTPGSHITLTSHNGQFPITIANDLAVPVNVTVELIPNPRLTFGHNGREQRTIPPHQRLAVDFQASAKTSGVFPIQVQLLTPDGHLYNPDVAPVTLYVRSTVYGTITLVITAAATAALLIAVAIRLTRRAVAARRGAAATA